MLKFAVHMIVADENEVGEIVFDNIWLTSDA